MISFSEESPKVEALLAQLSSKQIELSSGSWVKKGMPELSSSIKEWGVSELSLSILASK